MNSLDLCLRQFDGENVKPGESKHTGAEQTIIWRKSKMFAKQRW